MPEAYWDADKGEVKAEDFAKAWGDYETDRAARAERAKDIPADPGKYELKLPEGFEAPEGVEFNPDDPRLPALREFAHKAGWTQAEFSQVVAMDAARALADAKRLNDFREAELGKLGPKASEIIDGLGRQIDALAANAGEAAEMKLMLRSAGQAKFLGKVFDLLRQQGVDTFNKAPGELKDPGKIEGYETMTFAQKMAAIAERKAG